MCVCVASTRGGAGVSTCGSAVVGLWVVGQGEQALSGRQSLERGQLCTHTLSLSLCHTHTLSLVSPESAALLLRCCPPPVAWWLRAVALFSAWFSVPLMPFPFMVFVRTHNVRWEENLPTWEGLSTATRTSSVFLTPTHTSRKVVYLAIVL